MKRKFTAEEVFTGLMFFVGVTMVAFVVTLLISIAIYIMNHLTPLIGHW